MIFFSTLGFKISMQYALYSQNYSEFIMNCYYSNILLYNFKLVQIKPYLNFKVVSSFNE